MELVKVQGSSAELIGGTDLFLRPKAKEDTAIPTNFAIVEDYADGLTPGHLFVAACRPGIGKTA